MDWESPSLDGTSVNEVAAQESQHAFMARVYGWMFAGLTLTGMVALYTASSRELLQSVGNNLLLLFGAQFVLVLGLSWANSRLSGPVAAVMFIAYAALNGLTLSVLFLIYQLGSIGTAFLITAGTFGAMSLFATVTRRNLDGWGAFLFIGLIGVLLAGIVQIFVRNTMLDFVWSCASVVVFAGLTAYDTQKLRQMHLVASTNGQQSLAILGALKLYLDFINLFLALLRLFGRRK